MGKCAALFTISILVQTPAPNKSGSAIFDQKNPVHTDVFAEKHRI